MDKWQKRMEKVTANAVHRALQNQKRELQKYLDDIGFPSDIEVARIIRHSAKPVVDVFISRSQTTIERYYNETGKKWPKPLVGLDWNLPTRPEKIYLEALEGLHLSQNKWSITETTEERVKKLVTSGVKQGYSPQEISKNIENLDPQVFSKNRADLIAINQIGKAKQYGEWIANKEYSDAGYLTLKYWSTVNDNRVTRSHTANQNQGWIHIDKFFSGTGDKIAPASNNPRCRCAIQYEIGNKIGEKQPRDIQQKYESGIEKEKVAKIDAIISQNLENYRKEFDNTQALVESQKTLPLYPFLDEKYIHLLDEELAALESYTGNGYKKINSIYREWKIDPMFARSAYYLEQALFSLPPHKWVVYRWVRNGNVANIIKNLEEWEVFTDLWFMSTSTSIEVAKHFAKEKGIVLQFFTSDGRDVKDFWTYAEYEVLHAPWKSLIFLWKSNNIYKFKEL